MFGTGRIGHRQLKIKELEQLIEKDVAEIVDSLPDIAKDIRAYGIGKRGGLSSRRFHIIAPEEGGKWRIHGVSSWALFD